ncbi:MAG: FtsW/RodA/SpoVE family cell cycle protein [Armatimonadetes bacterium]|nr:FtsW/RodA/SpoVE family cell cycle protein [Armatimonadota bacterium]
MAAAGLLGVGAMVHACVALGQPVLHASRAMVPAAVLMAAVLLMDWLEPRRDRLLLLPVALISSLGIALLWRLDGYLAAKQTVWMGVGALVLAATYLLVADVRALRSLGTLSGVTAFVLLVATMLWGEEKHGARLWLGIPGLAMFQPGELAKVLLALFAASALTSYREATEGNGKQTWLTVGLVAVGLLAVAVFLLQQDFGAATLVLGVVLVMAYVATGASTLVLATMALFGAGLVLGLALVPALGHHATTVVARRLQAWVNPWASPLAAGYQAIQGLLCFAHGGLFGAGVGQGLPGALPVAESDMIYAVAAEDLGYAGSITLLLAYALIAWRGFQLALASEDTYSSLLASGLATLLALQSLVIVGGVLRVVPLTGLTLPWLSYGGSSVVASFITVGLLLCISRDSVRWPASVRGKR